MKVIFVFLSNFLSIQAQMREEFMFEIRKQNYQENLANLSMCLLNTCIFPTNLILVIVHYPIMGRSLYTEQVTFPASHYRFTQNKHPRLDKISMRTIDAY